MDTAECLEDVNMVYVDPNSVPESDSDEEIAAGVICGDEGPAIEEETRYGTPLASPERRQTTVNEAEGILDLDEVDRVVAGLGGEIEGGEEWGEGEMEALRLMSQEIMEEAARVDPDAMVREPMTNEQMAAYESSSSEDERAAEEVSSLLTYLSHRTSSPSLTSTESVI